VDAGPGASEIGPHALYLHAGKRSLCLDRDALEGRRRFRELLTEGGMAAMLAVFARIVREKPAGAGNLVMACSVDEEHTFLGVQRLVQKPVEADMAIVAEPTQLQIVNAHKGVCRWYITTSGRACHSSRPEQGVNAIYRMGSLLTAIERYAAALRLAKVDPLLGPATLSVGRIEGGTSANTVPDCCRIEIDRRLLPGESAADAPGQLDAYLRSAGIDFPFQSSPPWLGCPALGDANNAAIIAPAKTPNTPPATRLGELVVLNLR